MASAPNPAQSRLSDPEYVNWLKASQGLIHLRDVLAVPTERVMRAFYLALPSGPGCSMSCTAANIKKRGMNPGCGACDSRLQVMRQAHNASHKTPPRSIFWKNSNPANWHSDYWEVAKCYLGPGQSEGSGPETTDCSNILTLWLNCSELTRLVSNPQLLEDVRAKRNNLFHSPTMKFSDADLRSHFDKMLDMLKDATLKAQLDVDPRGVADLEAIRDGPFSILTERERQVWEDLMRSCQHNLIEMKDLKRFLTANPDLLEQLDQSLRQTRNIPREEMDTQKTTMGTLRQESGTLRQEMPAQQTTIDTLMQEMKAQKTTIDTLRQQTGTLQQQTGTLRQETDALRHEMAAQKTTTGTLRQEIEAQKTTKGTLQQQTGTVRQETGALRVEYDKNKTEVASLQQKVYTVRPDLLEAGVVERLRDELARTYLAHYSQLQLVPWANIKLPINRIYQEQSLRGRADEWRKHDSSSGLKRIFEPSEEWEHRPERILIDGVLGMGKSTLCQRLLESWALGVMGSLLTPTESTSEPASQDELEGSRLHEYLLVFFLRVRELDEEVLVNNLLSNLVDESWDSWRDEERLKRCIRDNIKQVLLLFDGYDEGNEEQKKSVDRWLAGQDYRGSTIIVTSRPGFYRPSPPPDTTYTLQGFDQTKQRSYAQRFFELMGREPGQRSAAEQLKELPFQHLDFLQYPLMLALVCFLAHQVQSVLPQSVTELYGMFFQFMSDKAMRDPINFSEEHLSKLKQFLQKVAFDLFGSKKSEMTSDILSKHLSKSEINNTIIDLCKCGLVCRENKLKGLRNNQTGTFLHQSFLDYFAARHFVSISKKERSALLGKIAINENMLVFVAGLCGKSEEHRKCFKQMMKAWKRAVKRERKETGKGYKRGELSEYDHSVRHACLLWVGELQDPTWLRAYHVTNINQTLEGIDLCSRCTSSCLRGVIALVRCAAQHHDSLSSHSAQQHPSPLQRIGSAFSRQRHSLSSREPLNLRLSDCEHSAISALHDLLHLPPNVKLTCEMLSLSGCLTGAECECLAAALSCLTELWFLNIDVSSLTALNAALHGLNSTSRLVLLQVYCSRSSPRDSRDTAADPWWPSSELISNISRLSELRRIELRDSQSTLTMANKRDIMRHLEGRLPPRVEVKIRDKDDTLWVDSV